MARLTNVNEDKLLRDAEQGAALDKWLSKQKTPAPKGGDQLSREIDKVAQARDKAYGRPRIDTDTLAWAKFTEVLPDLTSDLMQELKSSAKDQVKLNATKARLVAKFGKDKVDKAFKAGGLTELLVKEKATSGTQAGE